MTPIEAFGWFFLGAGVATAGLLCWAAIIQHYRRKRKFGNYIKRLEEIRNQAAAAVQDAVKETSELTYRDKTGKLCKVLIVIDHNLDQKLSDEDKERMRAMILGGGVDAGSLDDLTASSKYEESAMSKVQQFVFSGHAVDAMRSKGLEPDDVVRRMLKAAGRIA